MRSTLNRSNVKRESLTGSIDLKRFTPSQAIFGGEEDLNKK